LLRDRRGDRYPVKIIDGLHEILELPGHDWVFAETDVLRTTYLFLFENRKMRITRFVP
jgi:hypothetical protein